MRHRPVLLLLLCLTASLSPLAAAGAGEFRAPSALILPAAVTVRAGDGSPWHRAGGHWLLAGGETGVLQVPAWWAGDRPPRGEMVVLSFEYRDDFARPVKAEVYSGLGYAAPYSELHRFGGSGNGRWRVARIPASADFILRYRPEGTLRFRLVPTEGLLAIRNVRLVAPLADEEARYNAETRAWIAREQRRVAVDPRYDEAAPAPSLLPLWRRRPLVPYTRSWMRLIAPRSVPEAGEAGAPLTARLFRNDTEPVQLGIYANRRDLKGVIVSVDPLTDGGGRPVAEITVRAAEYAKVRQRPKRTRWAELFPQRLWPAYPFDVPAGRSHLVWLTVRTREGGSLPGRYTTTVRIEADGVAPVSLPLRIEILDARLLTMEEAGLRLGGCARGLLPEFELAFLRTYNHNMINLWYSSVRPGLSASGNSFALDFRILDGAMAAAQRQGFTDVVYFLGGNPDRFPWSLHLPRTLAATVFGLDDAAWRRLLLPRPERLPAKIAPLVTEWTRRVSAHARARGWPNLILTPFDEPAKYIRRVKGLGLLSFIKPQFEQQVRLLRTADRGVPIYASIHEYPQGMVFLDDVDIFSTNIADRYPVIADAVRAAGKTFWEYAGTSDAGLPSTARYVFGYDFASRDSRGSLVWAQNWSNRFDTLDGKNWVYSWHTPFAVLPSPYLEGLREAWDDRRLLATLKRAAARRGVDISGFLKRLFAEVHARRGALRDRSAHSLEDPGNGVLVMDAWREAMVRKLIALQAR